jgi:hypothetical protein
MRYSRLSLWVAAAAAGVSAVAVVLPAQAASVTLTYDDIAKKLTVSPALVVLDQGAPTDALVEGLKNPSKLKVNGVAIAPKACAGSARPAGNPPPICFDLPPLGASVPYAFVVEPAATNALPVSAQLPVILRHTARVTLPPVAHDLLSVPADLGKLLYQAARSVRPGASGALDEDVLARSLASYCKDNALPPPPGPSNNCATASVSLRPDGGMIYNQKGEVGSFCLQPSTDWGERPIVRYRDATQPATAAQCVNAVPGVTYRGVNGTKERPIGRIEVWAERSEDDLKAAREDSSKKAKEMLAKYVRAALVRMWRPHPAVYTELKAAAAAVGGAMPTRKGIERFDAARKAVGDAIDEYFKHAAQWKPGEVDNAVWDAEVKAAADLVRKNLPDPPWAVGLQGPSYDAYVKATPQRILGAVEAEEPKITDASKAVRALAIANQPAKKTVIPWPVFSGDYPISAEVKVLPLEGGTGSSTDSEPYYEDTTVLLFAFGVDAAGTAAIIQTDEKVTREASDVAKALAGMLQFAVAGGVKAFLPAGTVAGAAPTPFIAVCQSVRTGAACPILEAGVCPSVASHKAEWEVVCRTTQTERVDSSLRVLAAVQTIRRDLASHSPAPINNDIEILFQKHAIPEFFDGSLDNATGSPSSKKTSVTRLAILQGGVAYQLQVCSDAKDCDGKTDAAKTSTRRKIKVYKHPSYFSVALELGISAPLLQTSGKAALPIGGYRYEKVESATSPQQLYQLRAFDRASDHITISTLFVVYPFAHSEAEGTERLGLGLGPTLWRAGAAEFGRQWNLRFLWGPPKVAGLLLGVGVGLEWVNVPAHVPINSYVSVPSGGSPPDFRADNRPQLLFTGGLSLDLSIVTTVTDDLISKIRGGGSGSSSGGSASGGSTNAASGSKDATGGSSASASSGKGGTS